jgi:hypothetical protein
MSIAIYITKIKYIDTLYIFNIYNAKFDNMEEIV